MPHSCTFRKGKAVNRHTSSLGAINYNFYPFRMMVAATCTLCFTTHTKTTPARCSLSTGTSFVSRIPHKNSLKSSLPQRNTT